jgi:hypothetical protein
VEKKDDLLWFFFLFLEDPVDFAFDFGEVLHSFLFGFFYGIQLFVCILLDRNDFFLHSFRIEIECDDRDDQDEKDDPEKDCSDVVCRLGDYIGYVYSAHHLEVISGLFILSLWQGYGNNFFL